MKRILFCILVIAAIPYSLRLGASSLWDSNETFYAETPREMIESGDYINPSFNYKPRFNKPPLSYWVVALFYRLFGTSEAVERMPIAISAMLMIATAFALGRVVYGVEAGLLSAIGLAASPRFLMFSRRILIDVSLAMFMALALLMFILAERQPRRRRFYLIAMYVSLGLGLLTKGPVAALLPALTILIYLAAEKRLKDTGKMLLPAGIALIAAIVLPWYLIVYAQHGMAYIETFLLKDNLARYAGEAWGPSRGVLFYVGVVAGDFFPFSLFLLPAFWRIVMKVGLRRQSPEVKDSDAEPKEQQHEALLAIWILVIVVFYSLSSSKEDLYVLPAYPAAAVLAGGFLVEWLSRATSNTLRVLAIVALGLLGGALLTGGAIVFYTFAWESRVYELAGATLIGAMALGGGIAALVLLAMRRTPAAVLCATSAIIAINWIFVLVLLPDFERYKPVRGFCEAITSRADEESLSGYYRLASPSMVFYLRRPIFEYYDSRDLNSALASGKRVYCVLMAADYESLKHQFPGPTYILASRPILQVKLKSILDRVELPQVLLISNKAD